MIPRHLAPYPTPHRADEIGYLGRRLSGSRVSRGKGISSQGQPITKAWEPSKGCHAMAGPSCVGASTRSIINRQLSPLLTVLNLPLKDARLLSSKFQAHYGPSHFARSVPEQLEYTGQPSFWQARAKSSIKSSVMG